MNYRPSNSRSRGASSRLFLAGLFLCLATLAAPVEDKPVFGPFNAACSGSGPGHVCWFDGPPPTEPRDRWSVAACVLPAQPLTHPALVAGFGDGLDFSGAERFFAADTNGWFFFLGTQQIKLWNGKPSSSDALTPEQVNGGRLDSQTAVVPGQWQHLAATYDGTILSLFVNGRQVATKPLPLARVAMQPRVAPPPPWKEGTGFTGKVAHFCIWNRPLSQSELEVLAAQREGLDQLAFTPPPAGPTPEGRTGPYLGRRSANEPQDPKTFPRPVPVLKLERTPKLAPRPQPALSPNGDLVLNRGWEMADAAAVTAAPETIATPGFDTHSWYDATVPGTVLTTLVQQGVYPDPLHGLNNLLIPDDLARKSWWYRVAFTTPAAWHERRLQLTFNGINYHAEVWLNGQRLGETTGAFLRGQYDVSSALKPAGTNVLAVRVWPPPHSGVAQEESPSAGMGPNGTDAVLDGPSFFCTEGWDWIPTIRDRCTGLWQDVVIHPTGPVALGDPRVVTALPRLPDLSRAEVTVQAELRNLTDREQHVTLKGSLAGAEFSLRVTLAPHQSLTATASPQQFPQLALDHPRLWWPNGYGEPTLHQLTLRVQDAAGQESDHLAQRIGLRTVSYEYNPQLTLLVNGRRVFCKGGNWGLDDALKRVTRERLEPYVRLHRDAHLTMIRNWCGQSTSETLCELCDEYGLLLWNEFWLTTEAHDLPAMDADIFLANTEDTVKRLRNHACIAFWCGRNEGFPPPWINPRLADLLQRLDGTRLYVPSSWDTPVSGGGPYGYVEPAKYFEIARQKPFNSELGMDSAPTADAIRAALAPTDVWPMSDAWVYHDAHWEVANLGKKYYEVIPANFGQATNLDDFVRRAQMVNYANYRAMFEAWNARLWQPCSGVLLWMSHPTWPSFDFQIYSKDYDTHAAFFGVQKACEPLHVQWSPADNSVTVVNNLFDKLSQATVTFSVYGQNGNRLTNGEVKLDVPASAATTAAHLTWPAGAPNSPVQFLKLELRDRARKLRSENFYWHAATPEDQQALQNLPPVKLDSSVSFARSRGELKVTVRLANPTPHVALMTHAVLRDAATGQRILPAFASDNYLSLLPGENKTFVITCADRQAPAKPTVTLDGWNIVPASLH